MTVHCLCYFSYSVDNTLLMIVPAPSSFIARVYNSFHYHFTASNFINTIIIEENYL